MTQDFKCIGTKAQPPSLLPDRAASPGLASRIALAMAVTSLCLPPLASVAFAQETAEQASDDAGERKLGTVYVEARKRSESVLDIPETIDVVTADQITEAGITSVEDLGRQTPSVVLNRRQDNEPNVVIRGIGSFGNTQGIGFYIDDVQNFTDQTAAIEDVERIEILKGPQGTLYGGSNVGGAVKFVLKQPGDEFGMEARAEAGSFGTTRLFGALDLPASDTFGVRISAYANHSDGYVDNTNLGGHPDESDEWGIRAAFAWSPVDNLDLNFSYRHNELENGGNVYVPAVNSDDYQTDTDLNTDVMNDRVVDGAILSVAYDFGGAEITSVTSYTERENDLLWDLDYSGADAVLAFEGDRNTTEVFTQEVRLASTGEGPFDWLVGAYTSSVDNRPLTNNVDLFLGPDAGGPLLLEDFNNGVTEETQIAAFGTASYDFGRFELGGGLRIGRTEFTGKVLNDPMVTTEVEDTDVLPKVTLAFDLTDTAMLYANYSVGVEPGRVNVISGSGRAYDQEKAKSFEAGIKGTALDDSFSYELAAFYIDSEARQLETQFILDNGAITEEITNVGDAKSYGFEAGFSWQATPELTFSASGGYLNSEWDDPDAAFALMPVDGLTVPFAPEFTGNATVDYERPFANGWSLGLRGDLAATSSFYWDVLNTDEQSAYSLLNLRMSLTDPSETWEFAVRGENVLDAEYYTEVFPDVFGPGASLAAPGQPAAVYASVSYRR